MPLLEIKKNFQTEIMIYMDQIVSWPLFCLMQMHHLKKTVSKAIWSSLRIHCIEVNVPYRGYLLFCDTLVKNTDIFTTLDEIYLVFTEKVNARFIL